MTQAAPDVQFIMARAQALAQQSGSRACTIEHLSQALGEVPGGGAAAGQRGAQPPGDNLTKKELEETMQKMLQMPPGGMGMDGALPAGLRRAGLLACLLARLPGWLHYRLPGCMPALLNCLTACRPLHSMHQYHIMHHLAATPTSKPSPAGDASPLERFTSDLTADARRGKLDPVIGREEELRRCIHILSR
jgi:ATP-dependent Clp protease ATP-binding subunit ClpA